jgi:hypothetical protein
MRAGTLPFATHEGNTKSISDGTIYFKHPRGVIWLKPAACTAIRSILNIEKY